MANRVALLIIILFLAEVPTSFATGANEITLVQHAPHSAELDSARELRISGGARRRGRKKGGWMRRRRWQKTTFADRAKEAGGKVNEIATTAAQTVARQLEHWAAPKKSERRILENVLENILAGLASAVAIVPEASQFAITAGVSPLVGLGSTLVLGIITAGLGGCPGMISGASATCALVVAPLVRDHGPGAMSLAVALAGVLQLILGMLHGGKLTRMVPMPVVFGFVNGLAIKVVLAQVPHFQHPHGVWLRGNALAAHAGLVALSFTIVEQAPRVTRSLPSPLLALSLCAGITRGFSLPIPCLIDVVEASAFEGGLSSLLRAVLPLGTSTTTTATAIEGGGGEARTIAFSSAPMSYLIPLPGSLQSCLAIAPVALELALVGVLQSLLTLYLVDGALTSQRSQQPKPAAAAAAAVTSGEERRQVNGGKKNSKPVVARGKNSAECRALGLGNILSGLFGGMGGSGLLGQSLINVGSGGSDRTSAFAASVFVALGVVFGAKALGQLPVAALVGLMLAIAKHTFAWSSLRLVRWTPLAPETLTILAVTCVTVGYNLAVAVVAGVLLSALRFAWQAAANMQTTQTLTWGGERTIAVTGPLFFGSARAFQELCAPTPDDVSFAYGREKRGILRFLGFGLSRVVTIDFLNSRVWDTSGISAIDSMAAQYSQLNITLHLRHLSPDCRELLAANSQYCQTSSSRTVSGETHTRVVLLDEDESTDPVYAVGTDYDTIHQQPRAGSTIVLKAYSPQVK